MTIKTTPTVMAGITNSPWTMLEFVQMLEWEEASPGATMTIIGRRHRLRRRTRNARR